MKTENKKNSGLELLLKSVGMGLLMLTPIVGDVYIHRIYRKTRVLLKEIEKRVQEIEHEGNKTKEEVETLKEYIELGKIVFSRVTEGVLYFGKYYTYGFVAMMDGLYKVFK